MSDSFLELRNLKKKVLHQKNMFYRESICKNTVFQKLCPFFPHMNVADNIGYGLKIRKYQKRI